MTLGTHGSCPYNEENIYILVVKVNVSQYIYTYHGYREVQSNDNDNTSEDNHEGNDHEQRLLQQHYWIELVVDLKQ